MSESPLPRRRFLINAVLVAGAVPLASRLLSAPAGAAELPDLPVDHPQAKALAYVLTTEGLQHPAFKPGSDCANCLHYTSEPGAETGPCALFPGFAVAAKGWCAVWAAKPA